MAVNPNFTNANANTSFFSLSGGGGGGGGGSNFNTINLSTITFTSAVGGSLTTYPALRSGPGGVIIGNSNNTEALTVEGLWFGPSSYTSGDEIYSQSSWQKNGLTIQGNSTGTTYPNVISFNSQLAGDTNDTISMYRCSTIGVALGSGNGQQINMVGLASTLKSVYPSIVL